jgi:hypothetical protein
MGAKTKCDMPCLNGGVCKRRLDNDEGGSHRFELEQFQPQQPQRHYCVCPTGYTGVVCEIKLVLCTATFAANAAENHQHQTTTTTQACSNGNACQRAVDDSGTEYFHCECDMATSDLSLPYAAKFCEHASTVFCNVDANAEKAKKDRHSLGGTGKSSFCTNGGRCKEVTEKGHHHAGCNCPLHFSGQHCEISDRPVSKSKSTASLLSSTATANSRRSRPLLSVLVFVSILLGFVVTGMAVLIYHGQKQQQQQRRPPKAKSAQERARIPKQHPISEIEIM